MQKVIAILRIAVCDDQAKALKIISEYITE